MAKNKRAIFFIVGALSAGIALTVSLIYRMIKKFTSRQKVELGIDYGEDFKKRLKDGQEWMKQHPYEKLTAKSVEGFELTAKWWDFQKNTTVIYIHGYGNSSEQAALFSDLFEVKLQANILAPDCRGHGQSEGDYVGFGWQDRLDILKWIEVIAQQKGKDHPIILYGVSMGGASVLCASGEELPSNVKCICSDCGYSSLEKVFEYQIKNHIKLLKGFVMGVMNHFFKRWYGYGMNQVSPKMQVAQAKVPILFIHGEKDHFIPVQMAYDLYEACSGEKEILIIPDAKHALSGVMDWDTYCKTVVKFFQKHR